MVFGKIIQERRNSTAIITTVDTIIGKIKTDEDYLKELRDALGDFYDTMIVEKDDEMLLRFLRFTDYNIEKSAKRIRETNSLMLKYRDQLEVPFDKVFNPIVWKYIWDYKALIVFKKRDTLGRSVILLKSKNWNPDEIDIDTLFQAFFFGIDCLLDSVETQRNGVAVILDCTGLSHMKAAYLLSKFTMKHIMQLVEIYQGGYPIRFGGIYSVNTPFVGAAMYNAFKYLIKRKMRERIHISYSGAQVLQKHFPKDFLPQCLQGNVPDEECEDMEIYKRLRLKHKCDF